MEAHAEINRRLGEHDDSHRDHYRHASEQDRRMAVVELDLSEIKKDVGSIRKGIWWFVGTITVAALALIANLAAYLITNA